MAGLTAQPLAKLKEFCSQRANWHAMNEDEAYGSLNKEALTELITLADGCPVCVFAALRQSNVYADRNDFDMKKELSSVWNDVNQARMEQEHAYYG